MKISPTEPADLRAIGIVSLQTERYGVDILFAHKGQWYGIQRKELKDLLSSLEDGRLARELAMMKRCDHAYLLIEGTPRWTGDGELVLNRWSQRFTLTQYRGLLWSVQEHGVSVMFSTGLNDTIQMVQAYERWVQKETHSSLDRRPGPISVWGRPENKDYAMHLVMGIPGVGPELAERIVERFGVPFTWSVTRDELLSVEGIGTKKLEKIWKAIDAK